ncbi:MAG: efflux RND transporter permease subunit, partial [Deltaproteobacteria bacterium]|nr:efflux RND transporter permease subunit [Deltaproteobacteria bacterium]
VAEVATVGGFVRQYQVQVDPNKLLAYKIPIHLVVESIRQGNNDVGARLMEFAGAEYMIRGRGYIKSLDDVGAIVVGRESDGTPIQVRHVATVAFGPDIRRGLADLNGQGDVVSGVVVIRYGENALKVIDRVKAKLSEIKHSLPPGVRIVTTYDRSDLIHRAIHTLKIQLWEEIAIVSLVILLFLWHLPSALIPILTIPVAVILSFIPMWRMGVTSNIMSLGGIAVAIGALVDAAIVVVENAHKKLERWEAGGRKGDCKPILVEAVQEVGRASFFSLLVIAVSFLPVFALEAQEGRLFKPLAFTKNLAMAIAAVLAITLTPALITMVIRMRPIVTRWAGLTRWLNIICVGTIHSEEQHPISRRLFKLYEPAVRYVLAHPKRIIRLAVLLVVASIIPFWQLGGEFMPPLNEGTILYMPTTLPGISVTESERLLQSQDKALASFPEVATVLGKAGRAETATDPAPLSMMETTVVLKPEVQWPKVRRWYSWMPEPLKWVLRRFWPEHRSWNEIVYEQMDPRMQFPGTTNAWTMPIKNRIDMLATGIRTPIGIKVLGADLKVIENIGQQLEQLIKPIRGTKSIYAERVTGGYFLDITLKREELARYGLTVDDANMAITTAIGGENITRTVEGRARYPVSVRYARELREDVDDLRRVFVAMPGGEQVPLGAIADITTTTGPGMIRDENGLLAGYVYMDMAGRDVAGYVAEAKRAVTHGITIPTGYTLEWSGQYEYMLRVREKLKTVVPLTLLIIFLLLYLNTGSGVKTAIVMLAVPFSAIGAFWLLWLLGYNMSIAVWIGLIALLGLDAETGVFMLLYLDLAYAEAKSQGRLRSAHDLNEAIVHGAVRRLRPKLMTVACAFVGLLPIMWSYGTGADVMKRVAAPMVGGLITSFLLELFVYPAIYFLWKRRELARAGVVT